MIVDQITEITLMGILDRGIPNKECIAMQVKDRVNLGQYGIMLGVYSESKLARPFQDNLFWFGDGLVEEGDWIFINTGDGEPRTSETIDKQNSIYSLFWKKKNTIFANTNIVPILFKIEAVNILEPPIDVLQIDQ
ncbi:MAG: hypothetical protein ACXW1W_20515 [Methylococcaceae bacterium]